MKIYINAFATVICCCLCMVCVFVFINNYNEEPAIEIKYDDFQTIDDFYNLTVEIGKNIDIENNGLLLQDDVILMLDENAKIISVEGTICSKRNYQYYHYSFKLNEGKYVFTYLFKDYKRPGEVILSQAANAIIYANDRNTERIITIYKGAMNGPYFANNYVFNGAGYDAITGISEGDYGYLSFGDNKVYYYPIISKGDTNEK